MTTDDIIRMAREAGVLMEYSFVNGATHWDLPESFERFAALVVAAEREECAKVADEQATAYAQLQDFHGIDAAESIADAIRARGEA